MDKVDMVKDNIERMLGIKYEEFEKLDFDDQQKIIKEYHKNNPKKATNTKKVMIGNGEHATFVDVEKGENILIGSDEHSCFVEVGVKENNDVPFVKTIKKKFKR